MICCFWVTLGVIVGGRLGYVMFYNAPYYLANPGAALAVWQGGMAFHGGALGVILAVIYFARKNKIPLLSLGDMVAITVPFGLLCGRLANFINGELWGRVTDAPWGVIFPGAGPTAPSEPALRGGIGRRAFAAGFECFGWRFKALAKPGLLTGLFLIGYGASRFVIEYVREPDAHIGFIFDIVTMGQILSLPMMLAGAGFVYWATTRK